MNTPSPLIPQGTSPDRGKSSLYFKILTIVSVHVVVIGVMLLQGCEKTKTPNPDTTTTSTEPTNDLTTLPPVNTSNPPPVFTPPGSNAYQPTPAPYTPGSNPAPAYVPPPTPAPVPPPAPEGTEYVVARGDTLAVIAKKNGVSLKALKDANPGVDPRKLKIGQKVQIPGGGATATLATSSPDSGDTTIYVVKAGDMLGRIAKKNGTTVAKLKALNDLKTSSIKVGQKLKIPGATSTAAVMPSPAPAPAPPVLTPPSYATTSQPAAGGH